MAKSKRVSSVALVQLKKMRPPVHDVVKRSGKASAAKRYVSR